MVFCGEENQEFAYGFLEENPFFFVDAKNKEMYSDSFGKTLTELSEEYQVGLFAQDTAVGKDRLDEVSVYLNTIQLNRLKKDGQYLEGECKSLFSDPVRVLVYDFCEFAAREGNMPDRVYVIGSLEDAQAIRERLVRDYNVSEVESGEAYVETDVIIFLWAITGIAFLFLTAVDTIAARKRGLIRAVIGVDRRRQMIEGVIGDALGLSIAFLLVYKILGHWYVYGSLKIHVICLAVLLLGSLVIQVVFSRSDVRRALRQVQIDRDVLGILCVVKVVITVLSLLIIAGLVNEIHKTKGVRDTLDKLGKLKDYHFVSVFCLDENPEEERNYQERLAKLISGKQADYRPIYLSERGYGASDDDELKMVEVSYYARDLLDLTKQYHEADHSSDYIVLIPAGFADDEEAGELLEDMLRDACGGESFEKVVYDESTEVVCTTGGEGRLTLTSCKNPVVLLRNHPDTGASIARVMQDINEGAMKVMFCLPTEADIEEVQRLGSDRYLVATGEVHALVEEQVHRQEVFVLSESILCALVLLYNFMLSLRLTRIDYLVNRRKNTIGMILGRSLFERYRGTMVRYAVTTLVSLAVITVLCLKLRFAGLGWVLACGGILCIFDVAVYLICMRRMERKNTKSVITGGIYA